MSLLGCAGLIFNPPIVVSRYNYDGCPCVSLLLVDFVGDTKEGGVGSSGAEGFLTRIPTKQPLVSTWDPFDGTWQQLPVGLELPTLLCSVQCVCMVLQAMVQ